MSFNGKRGFSIVEVMVSLSIFMFVFLSCFTLILTAVQGATQGRERVLEIAKAQKGLADGYYALTYSCGSVTTGTGSIDIASINPDDTDGNPSLKVSISTLPPEIQDAALGYKDTNFLMLTSSITWYRKIYMVNLFIYFDVIYIFYRN